MNKKIISLCLTIIVLLSIMLIPNKLFKQKEEIHKLTATVLSVQSDTFTVQDDEENIYTFYNENTVATAGDRIVIEYAGLIDKNKSVQTNDIKSLTFERNSSNGIPLQDNGIFKQFYIMANNKLKELTLDEKIGQLLLVRYPDSGAINDLKKYNFSGFVFFKKDFDNKTKDEVIDMINNLQKNSKIPLLTAVDEEGGSVVRVSSNPNLANAPFKSPHDLYEGGGFDSIKKDTINKSELLKSLGLNLNLAPVVDVSTDPSDYIYNRSLGENTALTSEFAETVIKASKGTGVSYTLKHFPGYGNNADTHTASNTDTRSYDDILNNDIPPFEAGIDAGAEAVLVSHNIVSSIDNTNPASLSANVHNLLRNDLGFTGVIITDDLSMGATSSISDANVKAILAGNDLIITTDYEQAFNDIKAAVNDGTISEDLIDKLALRILAWKYYKGLIIEK